jgi:anthranilate phosphoribosyltransferase
MMLRQEATPAQIGAFMIAHRIRRPTGEELAGMLDAYEELGPSLQAIANFSRPLVFGMPYDGRTRTIPVILLTALILASAGCPVVLHGGDRMPTKEGDPLILFWQGLGVDWTTLSLAQVQTTFEHTGIGFVYLPTHFPLAHGLVSYREQIGKRPPFATMELMWCPYAGSAHVVSGFVHPPTEAMFQEAFALRQISQFTTVKGLEGSCDLPRERTAIFGLQTTVSGKVAELQRQCLHPREFGFEGVNVPLVSSEAAIALMHSVLEGQPSELLKSALWNGGFYLWRCGISPSIEAGIAKAETVLTTHEAKRKLQEIQQAIAPIAAIR